MTITPEMLKVVAEGMGYVLRDDTPRIKERICVWNGKDVNTRCLYKPHLTNAEQCMEIMEKLKLDLGFDSIEWCVGKYGVMFEPLVEARGKTINEAVVLAAYEYFKEVK